MKIVKKVISYLLIGAVSLSLAACAGNDPKTETTKPAETTEAVTTETSAETTTEEDPTMDIDGFRLVGEDGEGESAVDNTSGLKYFYYSYDGTIGGNNYHYEVREEDDGKVVFECEFMEYDYGTMTQEVDSKVLDDLYQMYLDQRLACWNGYSKYAEGVDDGDGFYLSMKFKDGGTFTTSGSNCYPDGYFEFTKKMGEILAPVIEEMKEKNWQQVVGEGIEGDLSSFMVNFIDRGDSGDDKYEFFVMRSGVREKNFDVQITSESGEFFEKGKYNWYCALPDEAIDFDGIKALIEKYDLIKWYNYDEAAEDYNNSEWFQVSFGFENVAINAMGTAHPEHYDEFRKEFLELMAEMIKKAEKDYGLELYQ